MSAQPSAQPEWHKPPSLSESQVYQLFSSGIPRLDLSGHDIGTDGVLNALAGCLRRENNCIDLDISDCNIGAKIEVLVNAINSNPQCRLRGLHMQQNGFGPNNGREHIRRLMKYNTSLQKVYLAGNDLAQDGFTVHAVIAGLRENPRSRILYIDLSSNGFEVLPFAELEELLHQRQHLFINFNSNEVTRNPKMQRSSQMLFQRHHVVNAMLNGQPPRGPSGPPSQGKGSVPGSHGGYTPMSMATMQRPGSHGSHAYTPISQSGIGTPNAYGPPGVPAHPNTQLGSQGGTPGPPGAPKGPGCGICGQPLVEFKYQCFNCPKFSMCTNCYNKHSRTPLHPNDHSFVGMEIAPPPAPKPEPEPEPKQVDVDDLSEGPPGKGKEVVCSQCNQVGHKSSECPQRPTSTSSAIFEKGKKRVTVPSEPEIMDVVSEGSSDEGQSSQELPSKAAVEPAPAPQPAAVSEAPNSTSAPPRLAPTAAPRSQSPLKAQILSNLKNLGIKMDEDDSSSEEEPPPRIRRPVHQAAPRSPRKVSISNEVTVAHVSTVRGSAQRWDSDDESDSSDDRPKRRRSPKPALAPISMKAKQVKVLAESDSKYLPDRDERVLWDAPATASPRIPITYVKVPATDIAAKVAKAKKDGRQSYQFASKCKRDLMCTAAPVHTNARNGPGAYAPGDGKPTVFGKPLKGSGNRPAGHNTRGRPVWG
mmetsp:Transcript_940/g.1922  ORF Transcript_940/g.1922 Transcript_940/m.1922 type:complete len:700 (-) Transcript_940:1223-3322(-)